MSGLSDERLAELRQLHKAGSPAGWEACDLRDNDPEDESGGWYLSGPFTIEDVDGGGWLNEADTKLIAATRNALPDLLAEVEWLRDQVAAGDLEWANLAMKQTEDVIAALGRAELAEERAAEAEQRAAKARIEILEAHVVLERLGSVGGAPLSVRVEQAILEERKVAEQQLAAADKVRLHTDYLALLAHRVHGPEGTDYKDCPHYDCQYSVKVLDKWKKVKHV